MNVEVQMNNWIKKQDEYKYCTVNLTTKSLIIHVKKLIGISPEDLELASRNIADKMTSFFESNYDMKFGRPVRAGKFHWALVNKEDIIWERFQENIYIQTKSAIMDETPPKSQEFTSVESATNYMNMGDNVVVLMDKMTNIESLLGEIKASFDRFFESQQYKPLPEKDKEKKDTTWG